MKRLLSAALFLACATAPGWASTNVCGNVFNQTWTPAGSPYLVGCDVLVSGLTIQPGVSVVFLGNYKFEVAGKITAIGTAADSIRFTRPDSVAGWQGLIFTSSYAPSGPWSELGYCVIEKATTHGIYIDRSQVAIHDCAIRRNTNTTGAGAGIYSASPLIPLTLTHCTISYNSVSGSNTSGGGICATSPLSLQQCTVNCNTASNGSNTGWNEGGGILSTATMSLEQCVISSNICSGGAGYGAGVFTTAPLTVRHCTISGNIAIGIAQASIGQGGGIYSSATLHLFDCSMLSNSARAVGTGVGPNIAQGGGVFAAADTSAVTMERCVVDDNLATATAVSPAGFCYGAGIFSRSALRVCNTEIARNQTSAPNGVHGSGVYLDARSATLLNCTIAYNSYTGLANYNADSVIIWNSIVFFNNSGGTQLENPVTNVAFSDIQMPDTTSYHGTGNITRNPIFNSLTDLSISVVSPCIDAGSPLARMNDVCFPPSQGSVRNDMGKGGGAGACTADERGPVSVGEPTGGVAIAMAISPNPARGGASISFALAHEGLVNVAVWDVQGRKVASLIDQKLSPGVHTVKWDGRGRDGAMNPGVYMVRLMTQDRSEVRRLALLR